MAKHLASHQTAIGRPAPFRPAARDRGAVSEAAPGLRYRLRRTLLTGQPSAAEAMVQWPDRRGIMPQAALLRSKTRDSLAGWTLRRACGDAALWPGGVVSVGITAPQMLADALPGQVAGALEASGLEPERLELLFAEKLLAAVDTDLVLNLAAIRDLGVGIAMDEFGADLGNLSTLRRLPLTTLKLARGLVRGLPEDREDAAIAQAVAATAHALGLAVVADGIDTESQFAFLSGCGCDEGQGALFGAPLATEAMQATMAAAHG